MRIIFVVIETLLNFREIYITLASIKAAYLDGKLTKVEYIQEMHRVHSCLYDYTDFLCDTNIEKIEIMDESVIMTSRDTKIKMLCDRLDQRIAPIEILNFGAYEKIDADMMKSLIDPGSCILDIGANFGWYSMNLAKQVLDLKVHAFEPVPKTFDYLEKNIKLNQITTITAYNFGFSDKEDEKTFYFYPKGSGNASLKDLSERSDVEKIICKVKRLDDFVSSRNIKVDFIKCDVEGAELFVFQGGLSTLKTLKPIIFTEMLRKWSAKFNYNPNQLIQLLSKVGYACFTATSNSLKEFHAMSNQTTETNFFFLHREKHAEKIKLLGRSLDLFLKHNNE